MSYTFSVRDVAFLRSRHGIKALETASSLALTAPSMIADIAELRARYDGHDAALIETVTCRRRARGKLRGAEDLLLSDEALQQATNSVVAQQRAAEISRRFPGAVVHDVTCSVGAELVELTRTAGIAGVIGSDIDPVRLAICLLYTSPSPRD